MDQFKSENNNSDIDRLQGEFNKQFSCVKRKKV